jgi:16S rRNA (guanine527-N7)-methyltransferase
MTPAEFQAATDVSRETLTRLEAYLALLRRWQRAINLVAMDTLDDAWRRHVFDSAQLFPHLPVRPGAQIFDLGSGAGFPGLVLAILAAGVGRAATVHLVDSDTRKAAFLLDVIAATGLTPAQASVHAVRAETLAASHAGAADAVTARALAPLAELLPLAAPLLAPGGICLFLKGARAGPELTAAGETWKMRVDRIPSRSDPSGVILRLQDIEMLHP